MIRRPNPFAVRPAAPGQSALVPRLSVAAFRMRLYIAVAKTCLYRTIRATCSTNRAPEPAGEGVSAAAEMVHVTDCKSNGESGPKMTSRYS